ncbi:MAG: hypothetical protein V5A72_01195 [Candidatus Nanohaloarchaea archaeon]
MSGLLISKGLQSYRNAENKHYIIYFLGGLAAISGIMLLYTAPSITCMEAVTDTAQNPVTGECEIKTFTCTSKFPWYYQECNVTVEELCEDLSEDQIEVCAEIENK